MKRYLVVWEIDIDADTALDAARQALEIHRDKDSIAVVFDVIEADSNGEANGEAQRIDLLDIDNDNEN